MYLVVVPGGVVATLILSSAVGYLPYSDRPGPGWYRPSFSLAQAAHYLSWGVLLSLPSVVLATGMFVWLRLLQLLDTPRLAIRILGGTVAGALSVVLIAEGGWFINLAPFAVWVGGLLGVAWAGVLMPRLLDSPLKRPVRWARLALLAAAIAMPAVTVWAIFVPGYSQHLSLQVMRVDPSGSGPLIKDRGKTSLEPHEIALLESLFATGSLHNGVSGASSSGAGTEQARMLVVVTGPLPSETRLKVPKAVSVVYVLRGANWVMYPAEAPTLRDTIRLLPGASPNEALLAWPDMEPTPFQWNPTAE